MVVEKEQLIFNRLIAFETLASSVLLLSGHFAPVFVPLLTTLVFLLTIYGQLKLFNSPPLAIMNLSFLIMSGVIPFFLSLSGYYFNYVFFGITILIAHKTIWLKQKEIVLILLLFAITFTNSFYSLYSSGSSLGDKSTIYTIVFPLTLFILISNNINSEQSIRTFFITLFIAICVSSFDFFLTYLNGSMFPSEETELKSDLYQKVSGISNQVNFLASYIVYLLPVMYHYYSKMTKQQKLWTGLTMALQSFLLLYMSSRSALIMLAGFIVYKIVFTSSVPLRTKFAILVMTGGAFWAAVTFELPITKKLKVTGGDTGDEIRVAKIDEALKVFYDEPIFGVGLNGYTSYSGMHHGNSFNTHNTILSVLTEQGIVGLILFLAIFILPFANFSSNKAYYSTELLLTNKAIIEYVIMIFFSFFFVHAHGDANYYVLMALAIKSTSLISEEQVVRAVRIT